MAALGNYFADSDVGVDLILIEVPESYWPEEQELMR
jgi:hypothetical protein